MQHSFIEARESENQSFSATHSTQLVQSDGIVNAQTVRSIGAASCFVSSSSAAAAASRHSFPSVCLCFWFHCCVAVCAAAGGGGGGGGAGAGAMVMCSLCLSCMLVWLYSFVHLFAFIMLPFQRHTARVQCAIVSV